MLACTAVQSKIVRRSIVHYVNKERRRRGLRPLSGHQALIRAAQGHSQWMANRSRFSHTGTGGSSPSDRASKAGYASGVGENIWQVQSHYGRGGTWKSRFQWDSDWKLGKAAVISWMNSPGHRQNILTPGWQHIGVGVVKNKRGKIYLTQNFGGNFGSGVGGGEFMRVILLCLSLIVVPAVVGLTRC